MHWNGKADAAVWPFGYGGGRGCPVWQGVKPADRRRSYDRYFISIDGTSDLGRMYFSQEYFNSCHSFISIISDACPWGRRYQIIFHDGQFAYNLGICSVHGIQFSCGGGGGSLVFGGGQKQASKSPACGNIFAGNVADGKDCAVSAVV